jgi:acyl-CoA reductase-like NAD-dependent aldehyde dehydrogenase
MNARKAIVEREIVDEFLKRLVDRAERLGVGDPGEPGTVVGPLITPNAVMRVQADVDDALAKGARLLTGGRGDGPLYPPTILVDVPQEARIAHEETFGPVLVVQPVDDVDEAIRVANDHRYGLSAGILTNNHDAGLAMAAEIEAGMVRIGDQTVHDEPQMPLGGVRDSGWGRAGPHSIEDFTQVQWVSVQSGTRTFPI